jgi:hypothetical protein
MVSLFAFLKPCTCAACYKDGKYWFLFVVAPTK